MDTRDRMEMYLWKTAGVLVVAAVVGLLVGSVGLIATGNETWMLVPLVLGMSALLVMSIQVAIDMWNN